MLVVIFQVFYKKGALLTVSDIALKSAFLAAWTHSFQAWFCDQGMHSICQGHNPHGYRRCPVPSFMLRSVLHPQWVTGMHDLARARAGCRPCYMWGTRSATPRPQISSGWMASCSIVSQSFTFRGLLVLSSFQFRGVPCYPLRDAWLRSGIYSVFGFAAASVRFIYDFVCGLQWGHG